LRRFPVALTLLAFGLLIAGCSGGNVTTPTTATSADGRLVDSGIANPRALRLMRTPPFPPPIRHRVTAADRQRASEAGWQKMSSVPAFPNGPQTEILLTDGTVLVFDECASNVYQLTPDSSGNYLTGTWSSAPSLPSGYAPLYFASAVLSNGYLVMNGGEYIDCTGTESNLGAIYDPFNATWSSLSAPSGWSEIGDGQSVVLSNGTYMLGNCCYNYQALLSQGSGSPTWTQTGPGNGKQDSNSEEGWTLLPDGDVLVVNLTATPYAQVYVPNANEWESAGKLPYNIVTGFEIGPQTLMPNGTVFVAGATGKNVLYSTSTGDWSSAPSFPIVHGRQLDVADGPSSVLNDGDVMVPASPGLYQSPTSYFIFDGKKLKSIAGPPNAPNDSTYNTRLLLLPNGQIMEDDGSRDIEFYTSSGKAEKNLAPVITSAPGAVTAGNTYTVKGTGFNGATQANFYGDDDQQATNFPLVRITVGGSVYYCRTHGTSFMGVASSESVSTSFDVPSGIASGTGTLEVVTNGIASKPMSVSVTASPHGKRR
jgi:hypothetical protein